MTRLVQLYHAQHGRCVALVEEPRLRLLHGHPAIYDLAMAGISSGRSIPEVISESLATAAPTLGYDAVYRGESDYRLLPCFDHPTHPNSCFVTGTGLTHKASAENRQSMHGNTARAEPVTDSMRMYRIGLEGGSPPPGVVGAAPEWFYKGTGRVLRAHGEALDVPSHADDGGEEAEIAGIYVIGPDGRPHRIGLTQSNEFSDHVMEAQNYLYLAASKLRSCSIGPELVIGHDFAELSGRTAVERGGETIWQSPIASGLRWMSHTIANLEHHHFKHDAHRHPGDAHVHFFGADVFSFRDKVQLKDGDEMVVAFEGMGRPLRNPIRFADRERRFVAVNVL